MCKTELVQKCEQECEQTGGSLFCEGQFLAASDLQACADQLHAELAISVDVDIDVEVKCVDGVCEGESDADVDAKGGCLSTIDAGGGLGGALMALGVVGLHLTRRRRRV